MSDILSNKVCCVCGGVIPVDRLPRTSATVTLRFSGSSRVYAWPVCSDGCAAQARAMLEKDFLAHLEDYFGRPGLEAA